MRRPRNIAKGVKRARTAQNAKEGGRPPGARNKINQESREHEIKALHAVLGQGSASAASEKVVKGIEEIAFGTPIKVGRVSTGAPIREKLQARIWLAERLFGHLPKPPEPTAGDGVHIHVHMHPNAPQV